MAASNSSDDLPSTPEPRPERSRLARPATAPSRPASSELPPAATPRIPRPFVPRGAQGAGPVSPPASPAQGRANSEVARARDAAADQRQTRPTEPLAAIDAVEEVAREEAWPLTVEPVTVDERAALDALAGGPSAGPSSVVPGADAGPRRTTPAPPTGAIPVDAGDEEEAETDADAEWRAMRELGAATPPAGALPGAPLDPARTDESEPARGYADLAAAVVPPADAWPEDVWTQDGAGDPPPGDLGAADLPRTAAFGNDIAPALEDDATLGARSLELPATAYPPAVPDAVDAYALDGSVADATAASAVYTPDRAHDWVVSAGGVAPEEGMPVPAAEVRADTGGPTTPQVGGLAARLRALADEVQTRQIVLPAVEPEMRDSEAIVALLAALLRTGR